MANAWACPHQDTCGNLPSRAKARGDNQRVSLLVVAGPPGAGKPSVAEVASTVKDGVDFG